MMAQNPLIEQVLSGQNRQLTLMAASGLLPLPSDEMIPLQVTLTSSRDSEVAANAASALQGVEPRLAADFITHQADAVALRYFGLNVQQPTIIESILRRRDTPRDLLREMAATLWREAQELLLLRQDAIVEEPQILVALESNPQLSSYAKRRIWEYREHLLPRDRVPPKTQAEILEEVEALTEEEVAEAIEEVREKPAEGKVDDATGLSDGQIRSLPVPIRIKLARGADRQMRMILIRDTNTQVAMMVLRGSALTEQEVEQIANSRAVVDEVLTEIPKRREWIRKYAIAKALVKNPRSPIAVAVRLVPRMVVSDLRALGRDKNIPDAVRTTALRLYMARRNG